MPLESTSGKSNVDNHISICKAKETLGSMLGWKILTNMLHNLIFREDALLTVEENLVAYRRTARVSGMNQGTKRIRQWPIN